MTQECSCGWIGESYNDHRRDTSLDDLAHIETSPLMRRALGLKFVETLEEE